MREQVFAYKPPRSRSSSVLVRVFRGKKALALDFTLHTLLQCGQQSRDIRLAVGGAEGNAQP